MEMQIIKLLNEFEKEKTKQDVRFWNYYQNGFHYLENGQAYSELLMVSKKYEFIKWLVNENKIDYEKVKEGENSDSRWDFETIQPEYFMIMLLSVQDNPIDFLISILK